MFNFIMKRIVGTESERVIKGIQPLVDKVNSLEPQISSLSGEELKEKTGNFRKRISSGQALDDILPEAFAVVREVGKRTINMRHFDVQIAAGVVLHRGIIAEMATGEGKTLVATLAVYLNALTGKGVHVVTVNDYLARRDREWMGPIYEFLGLTVGAIQHDMPDEARKHAYNCDITYGTNNEFGFDYLRDNMKFNKWGMVQREFHYAIVDEVDSILVDEARTPLIISGPAEESTDKYYKIDKIIPRLTKGEKDETTKQESGDYIVDEKVHTAYLTDKGEEKAAALLGLDNLHDISTMEYKHHVNQALRAHTLYKSDKDYIIKENKVIIIDEFTGRMMPGRRWSDGLHQAIEAKEGVEIERENQTLATITFQNFFRMYKKLAGMTGTAETEAAEFKKIYNLNVVVMPTNKPLRRTNFADIIYKTQKEKIKAICDEIAEFYQNKRPMLVGTISIEKNELISSMLKRRGILHQVLNAKYHELEAHIVAQAGRLGAVTIATNMAGRGTDIMLGGNPEFMTRDLISKLKAQGRAVTQEEHDKYLEENRETAKKEHDEVVKLGGLHVIGTGRHEARRIDNQLRGRAGRQGDPGSSRFYLSLQDDLMRIFGSDRIAGIMNKLGMEEGQEIQHPLVTKSIETAQRRVEERNFDIRKHLLEYDNVMNRQREIIYKERMIILEKEDLKEYSYQMIEELLDRTLTTYRGKDLSKEDRDIDGLVKWTRFKFGLDISSLSLDDLSYDETFDKILPVIEKAYAVKESTIGKDAMNYLVKSVMLHTIDSKWKDHLYSMDRLREGIGLRAYGQRNPLVEYQHEGFEMFYQMVDSIKDEAIEFIFKLRPIKEDKKVEVFDFENQEMIHGQRSVFKEMGGDQKGGVTPEVEPQQSETIPHKRQTPKVGRNDPCPCGSGKKYKRCCGK
ncbi:MAG: preprotein translocase subunit SecA [Candidatus Omnitrophica bacterium]|nr:preprotein translocase subunit SecA [Candidatus Omnitrophota bacterium]